MSYWNGLTLLNGEYMHMTCCAHILNLIVSDGLKEFDNSDTKIRASCKYVKSSPARLITFKRCAEEENITGKAMLTLDVPTRWNSTYMMLDVAEKFEKAFMRLEFDDPSYMIALDNEGGPPTCGDWSCARVLVKFLKVFYGATLSFSGSLHVTSNTVFHKLCDIQKQLSKWRQNNDNVLQSMAKSMKVKFDKYWENDGNPNYLLFVSVFLDPRYKLEVSSQGLISLSKNLDPPSQRKTGYCLFDKQMTMGEVVERMSGDTLLIQDVIGKKEQQIISSKESPKIEVFASDDKHSNARVNTLMLVSFSYIKVIVKLFCQSHVYVIDTLVLGQPESGVMNRKGVEMTLCNALDEALLDKPTIPNKLSEDILKCLMNIFLQMSPRSTDDMEKSSSSSGSFESFVEMDSRDPCDICAEYGKRDNGQYKHFQAVLLAATHFVISICRTSMLLMFPVH
ncbi:hypothetical protein Cni_G25600 [Canna indica]|uniref:hAT-like transposase RNase-H fold domain-containing protein n=1 Tax=Canna indica TaxID=4628 RepID=A0AAQ3KXB6_9LILI|nr:hypothetical protein Cni_G25600 [Canna indica]